MIDLVIAGLVGAVLAHSKKQTFEGKMESLQEDLQLGKVSMPEAQERYKSLISREIDKAKANGIPISPELKSAFQNGLDYKKLAGKVDPDTYNMLHAAYWYGDW
jgi:hypothetical protein